MDNLRSRSQEGHLMTNACHQPISTCHLSNTAFFSFYIGLDGGLEVLRKGEIQLHFCKHHLFLFLCRGVGSGRWACRWRKGEDRGVHVVRINQFNKKDFKKLMRCPGMSAIVKSSCLFRRRLVPVAVN